MSGSRSAAGVSTIQARRTARAFHTARRSRRGYLNRNATKKAYQKKKGYYKRLKDPKINTAVERAIVRIAEGNRVPLVLRHYYGSNIDPDNLRFYQGFTLDKDGKVWPMYDIQKSDVNMVTNVPIADHPNLSIAEPDGDGATQGLLTQTIMGRRSTDYVKVTAVTVQIRAVCKLTNFTGADPLYSNVRVKWAVISLNHESMEDINDYTTPDPEELMTWPQKWGYSSRLDAEELLKTAQIQKKTLASGFINIPLNNVKNTVKSVNRYIRFNPPLEIQYAPEDQNGIKVIKNKLLFVIRSDIPATAAGYNTVAYLPAINTCLKTHYFEP